MNTATHEPVYKIIETIGITNYETTVAWISIVAIAAIASYTIIKCGQKE